jgi:hypothetical protein
LILNELGACQAETLIFATTTWLEQKLGTVRGCLPKNGGSIVGFPVGRRVNYELGAAQAMEKKLEEIKRDQAPCGGRSSHK